MSCIIKVTIAHFPISDVLKCHTREVCTQGETPVQPLPRLQAHPNEGFHKFLGRGHPLIEPADSVKLLLRLRVYPQVEQACSLTPRPRRSRGTPPWPPLTTVGSMGGELGWVIPRPEVVAWATHQVTGATATPNWSWPPAQRKGIMITEGTDSLPMWVVTPFTKTWEGSATGAWECPQQPAWGLRTPWMTGVLNLPRPLLVTWILKVIRPLGEVGVPVEPQP